MSQITRIVARNKNLRGFLPEFLSKVGATTINLSNNLITEIPRDIGRFTQLSTLQLSGNRISVVPNEISQCKSLLCLELGCNSFAEFPETLCNLVWLHELNFNWNQITYLPTSIAAFTNLKTLMLETNRLSELPMEFSMLRSLETLNLSLNSFNHIPECIQHLKSLTSLDMSSNGIFVVPEFIGGLTFLTKLDLSFNKISYVPEELSHLEKLTNLNLRSNELIALPDALSVLVTLKDLDIAQNRLRFIPQSFFAMQNLKSLYAYENAIEYVDPSMAPENSALTSLDLSKNSLCGVPPAFNKLSSLLTLNLSDNSLTDYPLLPKLLTDVLITNNRLCGKINSFIGNTRDIRILNLSSNDITSIPSSISHLGKDLRFLELPFNRLSSLPDEFNQLRAIMTLNLSFNEFTRIPQCVVQLRSLQTLNVAHNQITAIDDLGNIDGLTYFNASGNRLKTFPAPLLKNSHLKILSLACNEISTIPPEIVKISTLDSLDLSTNAISDFSAVVSCAGITELNLSHNQIVKIPKNLSSMQCLQDLNLSQNKIQEFPFDVTNFPSCRLINLAYNEIKLEKGGAMPHFARSDSPRTTFLYNGNPELDRVVIASPGTQQVQMPPINIRAGWAEMRGKRPDMQDAICVQFALQGNNTQHLFGLYDGHSGSKTSLLLAKNVAHTFAAQHNANTAPDRALYTAYQTLEKEVEVNGHSDGSTALTIFVSAATLYIANTGDSKAVLCSAGAAIDLNELDRPENESETLRIRELGGYVTASGRVNGELGISKAVGDVSLHPFVSWEPTVTSRIIKRSDEFIIMGCDGIWDYVSSQEAVRIVRSTLKYSDPFKSAAMLRDAAYSHGSTDNISVIVIFLK